MRFGLDSGPLELDRREAMLVLNALGRQRLYFLSLVSHARTAEAKERQMTNALEITALIEKVKGVDGASVSDHGHGRDGAA